MEASIVGLRDPRYVDELARRGFVRIGPLLDSGDCARLHEVFAEAMRRAERPIGTTWFPTILLPDDDVREFITTKVSEVVLPKLALVIDPSVLGAVRLDYSMKPPGPDSELGPHQDFSIVDEERWVSLYLWIPLVDTNEANGTLHVLPGSHRFTNSVRARHVPARFDLVLPEVRKRCVRLDCVAGELVLMVSGVVHHSPPNLSGKMRLAAHGILKPNDAPLLFYYVDDESLDGQVEMYQVSIDEYVHLTLGERPDPTLRMAGWKERPAEEMTPQRLAAGLREFGDEGLIG